MQDAQSGSWSRESHVSPAMLESVRELNHRFLDLLAIRPSNWSSAGRGLPVAVSAQVVPLSAAQKGAAANCPYALFDLRFYDDSYWRARLKTAGRWSVADAPPVDADSLDFVRLALFFAWHVAATPRLAAPLILGMNEVTAAAFRSMTIDCIPSLAVTEAAHLTARWNYCVPYWSALTDAAARSNFTGLRRIQLYGLQLAAAARLS